MDLTDEEGSKDGIKATNEKLSKTLATMLKASQEGDALKLLDWAIELYKVGKVEVDESDFDWLTNFIKNHKQSWALVRGQLLRAFNEAKEESKQTAKA